MKRALAIFFLLLANIILLVHASVPHHNHDGDFCFISTGCETECNDHEPENQAKHHEHKHHGDHGDLECELKTKVIIPSNIKPRQEIAVLELRHFPLIHFLFIPLLQFSTNQYLSHFNYIRNIPIKLSLYCIYCNSSTGLRAPPSNV